MKDLLIGLDIGTSWVKAGLFDQFGQLLAKASAPVVLYSPEPGWAEQAPLEWWQGTCQVLAEVLHGIDPARVAALGLSGQCPGHVLVGTDSQPIGRAIIWRDLRAREEAAWITEHITSAQSLQWTGTDQLGHPSNPPARLLWLKNHQKNAWNQAAKVLQPKDFIALQLTGTVATDWHSAYCLVNPETAVYDPNYFDLLGIPSAKMPVALDPTAISGDVTAHAASLTGLTPGTQVVIGTIDAYCDNLAGGVIFDARAVDVAGTSESISLGIDRMVEAPGVYPSRIGNAGMFLCGPTQAGGDTLRWLANCFFPEFKGSLHFEKMEKEARAVPSTCDGLIFLPYLSGERAPIWDTEARGVFFGLTFNHTRQHCTRAVYESVGFAIRHILEIAEAASGKAAREIVVCGGGSQSQFWNQIKADILQRPVRPTAISETGCLGAAILASVGGGLHPDLQAACERMIIFRNVVMPESALSSMYETAYRTYRQLYPALKLVFHESAR